MMANLTKLARKLRKHQTEAEKRLWSRLRAEQIEGYKFRRQQPYGKYILDFVCLEISLVIEVDGAQHGMDEGKNKDTIRDEWLKENGCTILRFSNHDVLKNITGVMEKIRKMCGQK